MKSVQENDSAVQFVEQPSSNFKSLRLRYQLIQVRVSNFLQRIQIKRGKPAVPDSSSTSTEAALDPPRGVSDKFNPPQSTSNIRRTLATRREPTMYSDPPFKSSIRSRMLKDLNNNEQEVTSTENPSIPRRRPRAHARKNIPAASEEEITPTQGPSSVPTPTPDSGPVLKLKTPRPKDSDSSSHRIRRRRSSRTLQHDRLHSDPNLKPNIGDSGTLRHSRNDGTANNVHSKKSEDEISLVGTLSSAGSELDPDREASMETLSLHPVRVPATVDENNNNEDQRSLELARKSGYRSVMATEVEEPIGELDETDLSRIPILKLRKKSVNFHRTALQRISSSITNIPTSTRNLFRIRRRPQLDNATTFLRSTVDLSEKEPSNFIFSMLDLKKHRDESPKYNVAVGMGVIFRRESIRENKKDSKKKDDSDEFVETRFEDEIMDENLLSEPKMKNKFLKAQLKSQAESTKMSNLYFGKRFLTVGQGPEESLRKPARQSLRPAQVVTDEDELSLPTPTELNRILARYTQPQIDPLLSHPLSPYYTRPVFQDTVTADGTGRRGTAEAKAAEEQAAALSNYYPRTSFTAQFAHLLPTARRFD